MNTTAKRALVGLTLAGTAVAMTGTAHASGIFGTGDTGGQNRDESLNQVVNVIGDSFMSGTANSFTPFTLLGGSDS